MKKFFITTSILALCSYAMAKDIKLGTHRVDSEPYMRAANVWNLPDWIDNNLNFIDSPDLIRGPKAKGYTKLLVNKSDGPHDVFCETNEDDQKRGFGGRTPKFYCQLLEKDGTPVTEDDGDRRVIKVKYSPPGEENNEVRGEILGTRLMWALGFGADQMFYIDRVHCFGCTEDPYDQRQVSRESLNLARTFYGVAVEKKMGGSDELLMPVDVPNGRGEWKRDWEPGFSFRELMQHLPRDEKARKVQLARRDALRLLAIFMQHADLKPDNQRFICQKRNSAGQCVKPFMMIHDIGTSFGVRIKNFKLDKVHLPTWRNTPVWSQPRKCKGQMSSNPLFKTGISVTDSTMGNPQISEEGRQFLVRLLEGFASDRNRVRDLFRAAHIEERGRKESVEEWVNAFMYRLQQIKYPMPRNPNFRCPPSPYL